MQRLSDGASGNDVQVSTRRGYFRITIEELDNGCCPGLYGLGLRITDVDQAETEIGIILTEDKPYPVIIGKYLSSLRKLDHVIAPKEGFEAQL